MNKNLLEKLLEKYPLDTNIDDVENIFGIIDTLDEILSTLENNDDKLFLETMKKSLTERLKDLIDERARKNNSDSSEEDYIEKEIEKNFSENE